MAKMKPGRSSEERLQFCTIKSKLSTLVTDKDDRSKISEAAVKCHEAYKRGLFFLKGFCLRMESKDLDIPVPNHSLMIACLEQVCEKYQRGRKCKSTEALELAKDYREEVFSEIYPDKVDMKGLSRLKSMFKSRCSACLSGRKRREMPTDWWITLSFKDGKTCLVL